MTDVFVYAIRINCFVATISPAIPEINIRNDYSVESSPCPVTPRYQRSAMSTGAVYDPTSKCQRDQQHNNASGSLPSAGQLNSAEYKTAQRVKESWNKERGIVNPPPLNCSSDFCRCGGARSSNKSVVPPLNWPRRSSRGIKKPSQR